MHARCVQFGMSDSDAPRTFLISAPEDFQAVEAYVLSQMGCSEGRCSFFRTQDFVCLRREAMYGVRRVDHGATNMSVARASNGLCVYTLAPNVVAVGWDVPPLIHGLAC